MTPLVLLAALLALGIIATVAWRQRDAARRAPRAIAHEPVPGEVHGVGVASFPVPAHLQRVHGFALLDWTAAARWLATLPSDEARAGARLDLHRAWLAHLRASLHDGFWLHEGDDALILSSLEVKVAAAMGRYVTTTRARVAQTLGALASFPHGTKSVVLVMDDEEAYYAYVSIYGSADGEQAFSGGCFIDAGCPHFVVRRDALSHVEPVIVHELTHSALSHLRLPLWVDEGLAVNTQHRFTGARRGPDTPQEMHARHVAFWNDETIQQFWTGASFRRADEGNALSYDLARIIVAQLGRAWPAFERFAQAARRSDAGAASARQHLGIDLGAYVSLLCEREPSPAWQPATARPAAGSTSPTHAATASPAG